MGVLVRYEVTSFLDINIYTYIISYRMRIIYLSFITTIILELLEITTPVLLFF